jgi:hypothetical protein
MLQYVCDNCGAVKGEGETWILGYAADRLGVRAARREVTFSPAWDENRAVQWFAIHLCSEECKDTYLQRLFGDVPADSTDVIESRLISDEPVSVVPRKGSRSAEKKRAIKRRRAS